MIHLWEEERSASYLEERKEFDIAQAAYKPRARDAVKARAGGAEVNDVPTPLPPVPPCRTA